MFLSNMIRLLAVLCLLSAELSAEPLPSGILNAVVTLAAAARFKPFWRTSSDSFHWLPKAYEYGAAPAALLHQDQLPDEISTRGGSTTSTSSTSSSSSVQLHESEMKTNSRKRRFYHPQDSLRVFMYAHPGVFSGKDFCPPTGGWYHAIESMYWMLLNRTETAVRTVLDRASLAGLSGSGSAAQAEVDVLKKVGDEWDAISSRDPTKTAEFESGIRKAQGAPKVVRKTLASTSVESERRGSPRQVAVAPAETTSLPSPGALLAGDSSGRHAPEAGLPPQARLRRPDVASALLFPRDEAARTERILHLSENPALVSNPLRKNFGLTMNEEQASQNKKHHRVKPPRPPLYAVTDLRKANAIWVLQCWNLVIDDVCGMEGLNGMTMRRRRVFRPVLEDVLLNYKKDVAAQQRVPAARQPQPTSRREFEILHTFGPRRPAQNHGQQPPQPTAMAIVRTQEPLSNTTTGGPRKNKSKQVSTTPALPRLYGHADDVYKGPGLGFLFDAVEGEDGARNVRRVRGCQHALQSSPAMKRLQKATLLEMARVLNDEDTEYGKKPKIIATARENGRADWLWSDPDVFDATKDWILVGHMGLTAKEWAGGGWSGESRDLLHDAAGSDREKNGGAGRSAAVEEVTSGAMEAGWKGDAQMLEASAEADVVVGEQHRGGRSMTPRRLQKLALKATWNRTAKIRLAPDLAEFVEPAEIFLSREHDGEEKQKTTRATADDGGALPISISAREKPAASSQVIPPTVSQHVRWGEFVHIVPGKSYESARPQDPSLDFRLPTSSVSIYRSVAGGLHGWGHKDSAANITAGGTSGRSAGSTTTTSRLTEPGAAEHEVQQRINQCQEQCLQRHASAGEKEAADQGPLLWMVKSGGPCAMLEIRFDRCLLFEKVGKVVLGDEQVQEHDQFLNLDALVAKLKHVEVDNRQEAAGATGGRGAQPTISTSWVLRGERKNDLIIGVEGSSWNDFQDWNDFASFVRARAVERNREALAGSFNFSKEKDEHQQRGHPVVRPESIPATITNVDLRQPVVLLLPSAESLAARRNLQQRKDLVAREGGRATGKQNKNSYYQPGSEHVGGEGTTLSLGTAFHNIAYVFANWGASGAANAALHRLYLNQLYRLSDWWREIVQRTKTSDHGGRAHHGHVGGPLGSSEGDDDVKSVTTANNSLVQRLVPSSSSTPAPAAPAASDILSPRSSRILDASVAIRSDPAPAARLFGQDVVVPPMMSLSAFGSEEFLTDPWTRIFRRSLQWEWERLYDQADTENWWDYASGREDLFGSGAAAGALSIEDPKQRAYPTYSAAYEFRRREQSVFFAGGCNSVRRQELFLHLWLKKFADAADAAASTLLPPTTAPADPSFLHHLASSDHLHPEDLRSAGSYFNTTRRQKVSRQFQTFTHTSKFCLVVPGSGLFTTRFAESVVGSCIPLLKISTVPLPFARTLDWCDVLVERTAAASASKNRGINKKTLVPLAELVHLNYETCGDVPAVFFEEYSQIEELTAPSVVTLERYARKVVSLRWFAHVIAGVGVQHLQLLHSELLGSVAIWKAKRSVAGKRREIDSRGGGENQ